VQAQRIEIAKGLLETSSLSVNAISERVGYADLGSFRKLFSRVVGLTPAAYRVRFAMKKSKPMRNDNRLSDSVARSK
jgi:transcriptional regulator GlxA family with amidase domain